MTTEFIPLSDDDPSRIFEHRIGEVINSVIAFAYGTKKDKSKNIVGTGFSVGNIDHDGKKVGVFVTCLHVMKIINEIKDMDKEELKRHKLIDKKRYIAYKTGSKFEWREVGKYKFTTDIVRDDKPHENLAKGHDVCFCLIPDVNLKELPLSPDKYFMGTELGILGFPLFENLQKETVQPYAIKTILSCYMKYPFEREKDTFVSERLALGCIVGEGFSGSPVFSVRDGKIVGMVDYVPPEIDLADIKLPKLTLLVGDDTGDRKVKRLALLIEDETGRQTIKDPALLVEDNMGNIKIKKAPALVEDDTGDIKVSWEGTVCVRYPAGISFAVPSKLIQHYLDPCLKGEWIGKNYQKYTKQK